MHITSFSLRMDVARGFDGPIDVIVLQDSQSPVGVSVRLQSDFHNVKLTLDEVLPNYIVICQHLSLSLHLHSLTQGDSEPLSTTQVKKYLYGQKFFILNVHYIRCTA